MKLLSILLMPLAASAGSAEPAGVTITLTMPDPAALQIQYDVPSACGKLAFLNDGIGPSDAQAMRAGWQAMDACTRVDAAGIGRGGGADGCTSWRLRVPASSLDIDRVYPWAYPSGAGLYAHTAAYAVTTACGPLRWRVAAPGGAVVADGRHLGASGDLPPGAQALPLLFLPAALPDGATAYTDPALPPGLAARVARLSGKVERWLRAALPRQPYTPPFTITAIKPSGGWRGDAANRTTLRLALPARPEPAGVTGKRPLQLPAPPATADDAFDAELPGFLAHEHAHLAQPPFSRSDAAQAALLAEGGAEFLRWSAEAQLGWRTPEQLDADVEGAINGCILAAAGKPWRGAAAHQRGRQPYDCGLAFHVLALAARSPSEPAALAALDAYYTALRAGSGSGDGSNGLGAGVDATLTGWMEGAAPLDAQLAAYAARHAWLRPADSAPAGMARQLGFAAFSALMAADCDGPGFFQNAEGPRIAYSRNCKTLRDGMQVVAAEGRALVADGTAAGALAAACRTRGKAVLGLHDGATVEVPCDSRIPAPSRFYSVDLPLLLARLGIGIPAAAR